MPRKNPFKWPRLFAILSFLRQLLNLLKAVPYRHQSWKVISTQIGIEEDPVLSRLRFLGSTTQNVFDLAVVSQPSNKLCISLWSGCSQLQNNKAALRFNWQTLEILVENPSCLHFVS